MCKLSETIKKEIIEEATRRGVFARNIGYQEFLELYMSYQDKMKEQEFAEILGINYYRLKKIKSRGTKTKSTIEKSKVISQERIQDIQEEIRSKGYDENSTISYEELLRLYEPYKTEMRESRFAEILGISYSNWANMRHTGSRANILKKSTSSISDERAKEIQEDIREQGYANRAINYEEFLKMYAPYRKEITEEEFAKILGIFYLNFQNMRKRGVNVRIMKKRKIKSKTNINKNPDNETTQIDSEYQDDLESQTYEDTTPVELIEKCLMNGMNREQAIKLCMEKFDLTQEELLEEMIEALVEKKRLKRTSEGKVYLGEDR